MQKIFRDAMAHLASAVSIVTSQGKAGKVGLTVSSVTSVSDTPATVLFCVNQASDLHDVLVENGEVCINVLAADQQDLAKHFACMLESTMAERFSWDMWRDEIKLNGAVANLSGKITACHSVGTHSIFIVSLHEIEVDPKANLIYFARQFRSLDI